MENLPVHVFAGGFRFRQGQKGFKGNGLGGCLNHAKEMTKGMLVFYFFHRGNFFDCDFGSMVALGLG